MGNAAASDRLLSYTSDMRGKDTSLNVGPNNVASDVKVDSDELPLRIRIRTRDRQVEKNQMEESEKLSCKNMNTYYSNLQIDLQSGRSCRFSLSWHSQKTPGWDWPAEAGVPVHPEESKRASEPLSLLTSESRPAIKQLPTTDLNTQLHSK